MKYKDLPPVSSLALKKPEEIVQILSDHGFKIPKDDYYVRSPLIGTYSSSLII